MAEDFQQEKVIGASSIASVGLAIIYGCHRNEDIEVGIRKYLTRRDYRSNDG